MKKELPLVLLFSSSDCIACVYHACFIWFSFSSVNVYVCSVCPPFHPPVLLRLLVLYELPVELLFDLLFILLLLYPPVSLLFATDPWFYRLFHPWLPPKQFPRPLLFLVCHWVLPVLLCGNRHDSPLVLRSRLICRTKACSIIICSMSSIVVVRILSRIMTYIDRSWSYVGFSPSPPNMYCTVVLSLSTSTIISAHSACAITFRRILWFVTYYDMERPGVIFIYSPRPLIHLHGFPFCSQTYRWLPVIFSI